jgi:hypothetical protein
MALLIKARARTPVAQGDGSAGISPNGYGRVTGPGVEYQLGEYRLCLSVVEARQMFEAWRALYKDEGEDLP